MGDPAQKCRSWGVPSTGKHLFKKYFVAKEKKKKEFFLVKRRQQSSRSSLKLCGFLYFKVFLKTSIPPFGAPFLHKGVAVYTTVFLTA